MVLLPQQDGTILAMLRDWCCVWPATRACSDRQYDKQNCCCGVHPHCLQARLADATRQLLGGSAADGGLGAAEVRQRLAAAEKEAARANKALSEAETKVRSQNAALLCQHCPDFCLPHPGCDHGIATSYWQSKGGMLW